MLIRRQEEFRVCAVCERTILQGERSARYSPYAAVWVEVCPLCGCRHLYRQRDFNRALGCLLVVAGAALVPWTFGLSLPVFGLVDLWLYRRLKDAVVCYRCDTVYRDAVPGPKQGDFDLLRHDVLKYGKTWSEK